VAEGDAAKWVVGEANFRATAVGVSICVYKVDEVNKVDYLRKGERKFPVPEVK
jgi:hypothetical protein